MQTEALQQTAEVLGKCTAHAMNVVYVQRDSNFNTACMYKLNNFIPNVMGYHQVCGFVVTFIAKIRMRLTASGAPVAAKGKAVEPVNKTKLPPPVCSG
jgi:hypothetical protein